MKVTLRRVVRHVPRRRNRRGDDQSGGSSRTIPPKPPEPAGKVDVFHQGNVGETAQAFKNRGSDEDGLIAEQRTSKRIDRVAPGLPKRQSRRADRRSGGGMRRPEIAVFLAVCSNALRCSGRNSESAW